MSEFHYALKVLPALQVYLPYYYLIESIILLIVSDATILEVPLQEFKHVAPQVAVQSEAQEKPHLLAQVDVHVSRHIILQVFLQFPAQYPLQDPVQLFLHDEGFLIVSVVVLSFL